MCAHTHGTYAWYGNVYLLDSPQFCAAVKTKSKYAVVIALKPFNIPSYSDIHFYPKISVIKLNNEEALKLRHLLLVVIIIIKADSVHK